MSFPRHHKYKDSGVEWLGQVPGHWDVKRIGYYFNERREKVSDKDFPALSVTKNGIVPQLETAAKTDDGGNRKKVLKGDFVINSRSDRKGSAGASELDGSVSLICTVLRPQENVHTPFVHHLLRCQPFQEEFYRNGKGIVADLWSTNYSEMRDILLGMPPLPEQTAIAAFLDRETAKIDALVAEQQRLIDLLIEKRRAFISHAVTKGLNPRAPMKPSGIEWLGDVPVHWEYAALTRIASRVVVGIAEAATHAYADEGIPILRSTNIRAGKIIGDILFVDAAFAGGRGSKRLNAGDLVSVRTGNAGVTAVIPPEFDGCQCFTMLITTLNAGSLAEYYCYWMNSLPAQCYFSLEGWGTAQVNISVPILKALPVPIPPTSEQKEIVTYLDREVGKLDTLTAEAQRAIDLLQERRTALISAAVSGQIDVRNSVASDAANRVSCANA